jgi:hypothetical protein
VLGVAVRVTWVLLGNVRTHGERLHVWPFEVVIVPPPERVIVSVRVPDVYAARTLPSWGSVVSPESARLRWVRVEV